MNLLKRFSPFVILLVITILGIHLYAAFSDAYNFPNVWFSRDDAYYYFKVAQNITEGRGISFDGINLTNGYHPLWLAVCIPVFYLARFDLILPLRVLAVVMGILNAATAVLIYRIVLNTLSRSVAMVAASFWAFNFYIHSVVYEFGLETPLAAFTIVLLIWKLSQFERDWRTKPVTPRQLVALGFIAVLVMFSRLDLVFLAIMVGIWVIFRAKPIRYFLPLDMAVIFVSMTFSVALRTGLESYNNNYASSALEVSVLSLVIKIISLYLFGLYQHPRISPVWKTIRQTMLALCTSTILIGGIYLLLVQLGIGKDFPRSAFLIDLGISFLLILTLRLAAYWFGNKKIQIGAQTSPMVELQTNWRKWLSDGIPYYGILGGALALYMLFNQIVFGTTSPVSGQIKRWWGTLPFTVYDSPAHNWPSFFGISFQTAFDAWPPASSFLLWVAKMIYPIYPGADTTDERYYIAMIFLALLAFILLALNSRRALEKVSKMALVPLAAGCEIQILSYTATAYGGAKEWYWIGQMIFVTLAGSLLIDLMIRPLQKFKPARLSLEIASIALGIFFAYGFGGYVTTVMRYNYFPQDRPYLEVLTFLEQNTPPGSIIGMTGGGNVGYFIHDRTIVNMDGLINSNDYFHALQNKEAPIYLRDRGVDIIFANAQLLMLPPYFGQFAPYLERYNVYGGKVLLYLLDQPKY
jgi:hypothetical protein